VSPCFSLSTGIDLVAVFTVGGQLDVGLEDGFATLAELGLELV